MKSETITLGGGCFWCLEAAYDMVRGVTSVISGYAGGTPSDATYERVSSGMTDHAEVTKVTFDPALISLSNILDIFWIIHDPTSLNRQGADVGPQYRSCIFYLDESQRPIIDASMEEAAQAWGAPLTTEVEVGVPFYEAEKYHQDYFKNNPATGYCQVVIEPKLAKLREKAAAYLA